MLDSQESSIFIHLDSDGTKCSYTSATTSERNIAVLAKAPKNLLQEYPAKFTWKCYEYLWIYMNIFHLRPWHLTTWPASCKIPSHHEIVISTKGRFRCARIQSQIPQDRCSVESSVCVSLFVPSSHAIIPSKIAQNVPLPTEIPKRTDKPDKTWQNPYTVTSFTASFWKLELPSPWIWKCPFFGKSRPAKYKSCTFPMPMRHAYRKLIWPCQILAMPNILALSLGMLCWTPTPK